MPSAPSWAPFPLHYIEIGNEDWFDTSGSYDGRFAQIAKALRAKYGTKYQLIATTPVKESDANAQPDVLDDHYYKPVGEMLDFAHHYDKQERRWRERRRRPGVARWPMRRS